MRLIFKGVLKAFPVLLILACADACMAARVALYRDSRVIMGTLFEVQVYDANAVRANGAIGAALDEMARVDRLLSNYNPASELSRMNKEASEGPFHASAELFNFVTTCRQFYDNTEGTFDPTVGALVRVWGFFSRHPGLPSAEQIAAARLATGFDKVQIDSAQRTIRYTVPGLEMDPGGIGKGYAADRATEVLKRLGIRAALVSAGGSSISAIGHPPGQRAWRIAISNPANQSKAVAVVELRDSSLSTSGVSRQSLESGSHTYSHIFDPRTGEPVENMCQVTVVTQKGTAAEALSKAAFILSRENLAGVLKRYPGSHVLRLEGSCTSNSVWMTPQSESVIRRSN
jgi:thiamine biosynthesis lipoprotein